MLQMGYTFVIFFKKKSFVLKERHKEVKFSGGGGEIVTHTANPGED